MQAGVCGVTNSPSQTLMPFRPQSQFFHLALLLYFALSSVGCPVSLRGSRGGGHVVLHIVLQMERFQMQTPNRVVEENSQNPSELRPRDTEHGYQCGISQMQ